MYYRKISIFVLVLMVMFTAGSARAIPFLDDIFFPHKTGKYTIVIEGAPKELNDWLYSISTQSLQKDLVPHTNTLLKKQVDDDIAILLKALHSRGFYDATIKSDINEEASPPVIRFTIDPGVQFTFTDITITLQEAPQPIYLPAVKNLSISSGAAAETKAILAANERLATIIHEQNCLKDVTVHPKVIVDYDSKYVTVEYQVTTGKEAEFGPLTIEGLTSVNEGFVSTLSPLKPATCYKPSMLEKTKVTLLESRLFSSANIEPEAAINDGTTYPLTLTLKERQHRTIKAGAGYSTDEGIEVTSSWEHRNFLHNGEKVTINGKASEILMSLGSSLTKPAFLRNDQRLTLDGKIALERPDAYTSKNINLSGSIERDFAYNIKVGAGVGYGFSEVDASGDTEEFALLSFPLYANRDTRNVALDPTKGTVIYVETTPFVDTIDTSTSLVKSKISGSAYHQFSMKTSPILAIKTTLGSIVGVSTNGVPADKRFYAGGGGSVRGYAYQSLSPRDTNGPSGGKSLVEIAGELRLRFTETIGGVVFIDGGNAYEESYPDLSNGMRWGTGIGGRYYTGFGPLRLDIAVPLDKRNGIDDPFQLYVSFGQAF